MSRPDEATPLTIGPGPLVMNRSSSAMELRFSTDAREGRTPLALGLVIPLAQGEVAVTADGGPLSLDLLGIQEGALGLVDVAHATATGRARIALASDASALTFDVEGSTHGLAIRNARLAQDVVRGVDLDMRARGVLATPDLRLDEVSVKLGAAQLSVNGLLRQPEDHLEGNLHFVVPTVTCNALHGSFPAALLPAIEGARIDGTFGATGRLVFDTRALDDLVLDYDLRDRCKFVNVPPEISRDRFAQAFVHRVYLPDGAIGERTTGPGTPNWTAIEDISPYMQVAVLTTEDGAFLRHHGFNRSAIRASIIANLKAGRFVRGASTITMQLAKNLFLSRDKTLGRKLEEVVLTEYLEQTFSKEELMELYLNVIEFGPAVYGIAAAADYYFGRRPAELNLAECLFLASVLPSPLRYGALRDAGEFPDDRMRGLRTLMEIAHRNGRINETELAEAETERIAFWRGNGDRPPARSAAAPKLRLDGDPNDTTLVPAWLDESH
ncbi:MAG: transglycosylase domain-containing protein [Polyangiaceae bacterium]|nr:transglycosylase domain-containing protein [Polyangiaceae bacterium]